MGSLDRIGDTYIGGSRIVLDDKQVDKIIELHDKYYMSYRTLGKRFGVSGRTIKSAIERRLANEGLS